MIAGLHLVIPIVRRLRNCSHADYKDNVQSEKENDSFTAKMER